MNQAIAFQWANLLKSAVYQQGQRQLRNGPLFCVLGVLCDLHRLAGQGGQWQGNYYQTHGKSHRVHLPPEVQQWAGMINQHGGFALGWQPIGPTEAPTLAVANDVGCSFLEIAQAIEQHWQQL